MFLNGSCDPVIELTSFATFVNLELTGIESKFSKGKNWWNWIDCDAISFHEPPKDLIMDFLALLKANYIRISEIIMTDQFSTICH